MAFVARAPLNKTVDSAIRIQCTDGLVVLVVDSGTIGPGSNPRDFLHRKFCPRLAVAGVGQLGSKAGLLPR